MNELNKAIKTAGSTSPEGLIAIKIPIKPIIVADHRRIFTTSCKNNIARGIINNGLEKPRVVTNVRGRTVTA